MHRGPMFTRTMDSSYLYENKYVLYSIAHCVSVFIDMKSFRCLKVTCKSINSALCGSATETMACVCIEKLHKNCTIKHRDYTDMFMCSCVFRGAAALGEVCVFELIHKHFRHGNSTGPSIIEYMGNNILDDSANVIEAIIMNNHAACLEWFTDVVGSFYLQRHSVHAFLQGITYESLNRKSNMLRVLEKILISGDSSDNDNTSGVICKWTAGTRIAIHKMPTCYIDAINVWISNL